MSQDGFTKILFSNLLCFFTVSIANSILLVRQSELISFCFFFFSGYLSDDVGRVDRKSVV